MRKSKVVTLREALVPLTDGCTLALGGLWYHNSPAAAVREIIRMGVKNLSLVTGPPSSYNTDLLIGVGAVARAYLAHVSFEHMGLAPNFRAAIERDLIELIECDESTLLGGLMATVEGLPYHPIRSLKATDHLGTSPLAIPYHALNGEDMIATPALHSDIAVLHAQEADPYGNIRCWGSPFLDPIFAKTAHWVVVTVDRVISNEVIRNEPHRTTIPGYLVNAVVEIPYGAHPCSSHGRYAHDERHLREYIEGAQASIQKGDPSDFQRYLSRYVTEPHSHEEYLETVGGIDHIANLDEETR